MVVHFCHNISDQLAIGTGDSDDSDDSDSDDELEDVTRDLLASGLKVGMYENSTCGLVGHPCAGKEAGPGPRAAIT